MPWKNGRNFAENIFKKIDLVRLSFDLVCSQGFEWQ